MVYLVMRRAENSGKVIGENLETHLHWMKAQHESGRVLLSGPSKDGDTSIYVVRAASLAAAHALVAEDPLMKALPQSNLNIVEWNLHQVMGIGVFDMKILTAMKEAGASQK